MIEHYDLFAGIGGFSLALDNVFGGTKHIFVERDEFCQLVLKKHWPEAEYHSCINEFIANAKLSGSSGQRNVEQSMHAKTNKNEETNRINNIYHQTILTGGFPCQPFSTAGRRQGTEDDRYLWPAMFESIRLIQPDWIIAENVAGLVTWSEGMVLEQVCSDLESEGYEVQPFIIPACAVNAPHRRDRVWIVANTKSKQTNSAEQRRFYPELTSKDRGEWDQSWLEVATDLCRVDDGLPRRLDRNPRLKALGNAIVPQVAEEIFKGIRQIALKETQSKTN